MTAIGQTLQAIILSLMQAILAFDKRNREIQADAKKIVSDVKKAAEKKQLLETLTTIDKIK